MSRLSDLQHFYELMNLLKERCGGFRQLAHCTGSMKWPTRGVYFFYESHEDRHNSGDGGRVIRVGTHALKEGSKSTLWGRLSQHRGNASGDGGNHRGSIFRLLVGSAIKIKRGSDEPSSWGFKADPGKAASILGKTRSQVVDEERALENEVSRRIGEMPFLWLAINDSPGADSLRGRIERNSIALLSNHGRPALDAASLDWLGHHSDRERVRASGLWNNNHVDEDYDPDFLTDLDRLIQSHGDEANLETWPESPPVF